MIDSEVTTRQRPARGRSKTPSRAEGTRDNRASSRQAVSAVKIYDPDGTSNDISPDATSDLDDDEESPKAATDQPLLVKSTATRRGKGSRPRATATSASTPNEVAELRGRAVPKLRTVNPTPINPTPAAQHGTQGNPVAADQFSQPKISAQHVAPAKPAKPIQPATSLADVAEILSAFFQVLVAMLVSWVARTRRVLWTQITGRTLSAAAVPRKQNLSFTSVSPCQTRTG
ncbi:MAG: hypothetical protein Q9184_004391 [Pyrenodesmia sp. 2 TL-2023]